MNRNAFFASLRSRNSGVFGTSLSQSQADGVTAILDEGEKRKTPLKHMAYIFATAYHETGGKMQPVEESLNYSISGLLSTFSRRRISTVDAQRFGRSGSRKANQEAIANTVYGGEWGARELGNIRPGDGWRYRGRGLPQVTGRRNYTKLGMAESPDKAKELLSSVRMMFDAMENGVFTARRLSDFTDYVNMRKIINGTDKASLIAGHADAFERALRAGEWGLWKQPAPKPIEPAKPGGVPAPQKPAQTQPSGAGAKSLLVLLAAAGGALWAKWEAFTQWLGGLF